MAIKKEFKPTYVAKVEVSPKNFRYFYTQAEYQAYLNDEGKAKEDPKASTKPTTKKSVISNLFGKLKKAATNVASTVKKVSANLKKSVATGIKAAEKSLKKSGSTPIGQATTSTAAKKGEKVVQGYAGKSGGAGGASSSSSSSESPSVEEIASKVELGQASTETALGKIGDKKPDSPDLASKISKGVKAVGSALSSLVDTVVSGVKKAASNLVNAAKSLIAKKKAEETNKPAEPTTPEEDKKTEETTEPTKPEEDKKSEESTEPTKSEEDKKTEESTEPTKSEEDKKSEESTEPTKPEDPEEPDDDNEEPEDSDDDEEDGSTNGMSEEYQKFLESKPPKSFDELKHLEQDSMLESPIDLPEFTEPSMYDEEGYPTWEWDWYQDDPEGYKQFWEENMMIDMFGDICTPINRDNYYEAAMMNPPDDAATENCSYCTAAYELRRRGYDVTAAPKASTDDRTDIYENASWYKDAIIVSPGEYDPENTDPENVNDPTSLPGAVASVTADILKQGPGARGNMALYWTKGGGHSVAYEVVDGRVLILDCQDGSTHDLAELMSRCYEVEYYRTDNLELNNEILKTVRNNDD